MTVTSSRRYGMDSKKMDTADIFLVAVWYPWDKLRVMVVTTVKAGMHTHGRSRNGTQHLLATVWEVKRQDSVVWLQHSSVGLEIGR
jgi:hypothetical protein